MTQLLNIVRTSLSMVHKHADTQGHDAVVEHCAYVSFFLCVVFLYLTGQI